MQRSGFQKALLVFSIIDIIGAAFAFIAAAMLIVGGGLAATTEGPGVEGMTAAETGAAGILIGLAMLLMGVVCLIEGILGIRASKDAQKIMPVWVLSLIGLIGTIVSSVMSIANGSAASDIPSFLAGLISSAATFWIANSIKKQAGK